MKYATHLIAASLLTLAAFVLPVAANADDHTAHHPAAAQLSAAKESSSSMPAMEMKKMDMDKMQKMQEQMTAIRAAKDPKERAKLMDEHMQSMQDSMKMMHEKGGCDMKQEGMMMKHADASTETHEHGEHHQCMMEQMMEQMMQHMQAMKESAR